MNTPSPPSREASAEEILESISFEIEQTQVESEQLGRDKIKRASALAADVLIQIMLYDSDNKTRLRAAQEVLDRVYGTGAQTKPMYDDAKNAYEEIFNKIAAANPN